MKNRAQLQLSLAERPLQRIAMDVVGPLPVTPRGNRYILVVSDYFTKWKEAFPLADMEASSIARVVVNEIICRFGIPDTIHTDQGRNFESGLIRDICQLIDVKKTHTTPYHPESDGLVERLNRTLIDMLSMAVPITSTIGIYSFQRCCLPTRQASMKLQGPLLSSLCLEEIHGYQKM